MKKDKIINWSVLGLATLFVILYIVNKEHKLSYIYLIIGAVLSLVYAFLADRSLRNSKKEQAQESTKADKLFKNKIYENKDLNNVTKVIYEIYNGNVDELNEIIKKTSCDISYDFDPEENVYYLQIDSILGTKKKEAFFMALMGNGKEACLVYKDHEEDVSNLGYDEIISKIITIVKSNVKMSNKTDFVIRAPKWELVLYIVFGIGMLGGIIGVIIAKVVSGFETSAMVTLICVFSAFLLLCLFGVYGYFKEELKLENGIYTYRGFFKTQSCNAKDVKAVMVDTSSNAIKVVFVGKNNQMLLKYRDLGTTFKSGELKRSLNYYKIPLRIDSVL